MTQADALAIAAWRYPGEYAFYDADADPADLDELLHNRGDQRFAAVTPSGELVGHYQLKPAEDSVELGLGLRPDLTGQSLGGDFVARGIELVRRRRGAVRLTLAVAAFNERATREFVTMALDPCLVLMSTRGRCRSGYERGRVARWCTR
ncbi:MAG: GNAT family N-acetyltransferase [Gaiellaceae bacterium]